MRLLCLALLLPAIACVPAPPPFEEGRDAALPDVQGAADSGVAPEDSGRSMDAVGTDAVGFRDAEPDDGGLVPDAGAALDATPADLGPRPDAQPTVTSTSCQAPTPPFTALEQAIAELPGDTWFEAPNTPMRPLCPAGIDGCPNIINAWSGGAWDDVHRRMLVFGGGHGDYAGNELFAFDVGTMQWSLLSPASDPSQRSTDPLPDGKPVSRHSYNGLQFVPHANRFWAHGGSRWQDGSGTNITWSFEAETANWTDRQPTGDGVSFAGCCSESSVYDPVTRLIFDKDNNYLRIYDFDANTWTRIEDLGYPPLWPRYAVAHEPTAALDQKRRNVWFIGGNVQLVYDADARMVVTDAWVTSGGDPFDNATDIGGHTEQRFQSGGGEVIAAQAPGLDYDPTSDTLVAFIGGAVDVLDLATRSWSRGTASGAPELTMNSRGTYGRWRYIARLNAFILVNDVDQNVYFYKHTPRCGQ